MTQRQYAIPERPSNPFVPDRADLGILRDDEKPDGDVYYPTAEEIRAEYGDGTKPGNSYGGNSGDFRPPSGMLRE